MRKKFIITALLLAKVTISQSLASDGEFLIQIKDHKFEPSEIRIASGQDFRLTIENLDKTLEEFESVDLKKEKLVGAGKKITIPVSALKPGEYRFFGDFHQKTAQGKLIVK